LTTASKSDGKKPALAIEGGPRTITVPMPARGAFSDTEKQALNEAIFHHERMGVDPGYQGHFQELFCDRFNQLMGGGYSTAVATGTGAIYVAVAALELPAGSEIILSPITDPGSFNAIVLQGFKVSLADTEPNSFNTSWDAISHVITERTSAIMVVHCAGIPANIDNIVSEARKKNIAVIEDCSQAPGATHKGKCVGTFGDIAALSTMYRKSIASGGSGGLVYSTQEKIYHKILSHSDRGKRLWSKDYEESNAEHYLFPALNWNSDEFSCAIGAASLARLEDTINRRREFVRAMTNLINAHSFACKVADITEEASPFFLRIQLNTSLLRIDKMTFCRALLAEGVDLNPHYRFVIADWKWAHPYLSEHRQTPNAVNARDTSFNLYLNENYTMQTAQEILKALLKVEQHYQA
jgi:perosamine synthetase